MLISPSVAITLATGSQSSMSPSVHSPPACASKAIRVRRRTARSRQGLAVPPSPLRPRRPRSLLAPLTPHPLHPYSRPPPNLFYLQLFSLLHPPSLPASPPP